MLQGFNYISFHIKKFAVLSCLKIVDLIRKVIQASVKVGAYMRKPISFVWSIAIKPIVIFCYKVFIIVIEKLKLFFHTQHKLLAVITHRFAIQILVVILTISIIFVNIGQANEVRAEEFAEGSLVAKIFHPDEEITITADDSVIPPRTSYIDTSASLKMQSRIAKDVEIETENVMLAEGGAALKKSNVLKGAIANNNDIEQYIVQSGDTVSTIAKQFDVSTQTVLWSNNLSDASLIKPGDTLWILPTSGTAHTVKSGETVSGIASKYEADVNEILEYNDLIEGTNLIAGSEIIIPGGIKPHPPAPQPTTKLASFSQVFGGTAPASAAVSGTKLQWPTTTHRISQYYGWRHSGIDIDGEFGDPIYAAESGTVTSVGWYGGYGLQVVINHGNGISTRYAHLQNVYVTQGQSVGRGNGIGEMGSTGWSTGSHLHYEVIVGGRTTNPFSYH